MSDKARHVLLAALGILLSAGGLVYASGAHRFNGIKAERDIARFALPPVRPLENGSPLLASNGLTPLPDVGTKSGSRLSDDAEALGLIGDHIRPPLAAPAIASAKARTADAQIAAVPVGARMRTGPGFDRPKIIVVKGGAPVKILARQGPWVRVRSSLGKQGFVHESLINVP